MEVPASTLEGLESPRAGRTAAWLRRGFLALVLAVALAGGSGLLGAYTSTATATGGGYTLTLSYPRVARAGLDTVWEVRVAHPGGFDKPVTLAVTSSYFDVFETQGFHPDASKSTDDGRFLYLTFDPPPGDTLVVDFDAYVQPASQTGRSATIAVVDGTTPLVSLDYSTRLVP